MPPPSRATITPPGPPKPRPIVCANLCAEVRDPDPLEPHMAAQSTHISLEVPFVPAPLKYVGKFRAE